MLDWPVVSLVVFITLVGFSKKRRKVEGPSEFLADAFGNQSEWTSLVFNCKKAILHLENPNLSKSS